MVNYIQSIIAIILGFISTITDFKDMKIYNKNILYAILISIVIYILFYNQLEFIYFKYYIINLIISIIISFIFFYFKIWAAGDAKLFLAIIFMIPYPIYQNNISNIFPAMYLLIIIFSVAFIYVVLESIYLWIKDNKKLKYITKKNITKNEIKDFILNYFFGYFIILFINNVLINYAINFNIYNGSLIMLCNMLLLIFIYQIIKTNQQKYKLTIIFIFLNIINYIINGIQLQTINYKTLLIVLIITIFRKISEKYNYEVINIKDLKPRMILSFGSIMKFYGSKVKGLPNKTTESTDSRLTEYEVNNIKRWSKTKKGTDEIVIVKHLPFAPFILIGEIIFFVIKLYS